MCSRTYHFESLRPIPLNIHIRHDIFQTNHTRFKLKLSTVIDDHLCYTVYHIHFHFLICLYRQKVQYITYMSFSHPHFVNYLPKITPVACSLMYSTSFWTIKYTLSSGPHCFGHHSEYIDRVPPVLHIYFSTMPTHKQTTRMFQTPIIISSSSQ